jgi:hypothetical protein
MDLVHGPLSMINQEENPISDIQIIFYTITIGIWKPGLNTASYPVSIHSY